MDRRPGRLGGVRAARGDRAAAVASRRARRRGADGAAEPRRRAGGVHWVGGALGACSPRAVVWPAGGQARNDPRPPRPADGPRARRKGGARHRRLARDRARRSRRASPRRARASRSPRATPSACATRGRRIGGHGVVFDSDDLDAVPGVIGDVEAALGPIDIYVANTGGPPAGGIRSASRASSGRRRTGRSCSRRWRSWSVCCPACASAAGDASSASRRARCASRSATMQLSNAHRPGLIAAFKVLARQVAADGVTLNSVLPGRIATDRSSRPPARSRRPRPPPGRGAGRPDGHGGRAGGRRGVPLLCPRELHHGHDAARRRRTDRVGVTATPAL